MDGEAQRRRESRWQAQLEHVRRHSAFFAELWDGRRPPARLADLAAPPLCDKAMLRAVQAAHRPCVSYFATLT